MSKRTKLKHITSEILDDCILSNGQSIVKVLQPKGNYLYEVETITKDRFLVSMPSKFRNTIWVKCGNFVVIEDIKEGNKVKGEIAKILMKHHIKFFKKEGIWPMQFDEDDKTEETHHDFECESLDD